MSVSAVPPPRQRERKSGKLLYLIDKNLGYRLSLIRDGAYKIDVISICRVESAGLDLQ